MWHWQRNGLSAIQKLQRNVLIVSCCIHALFLVLLFIVYRGYYAQLHIEVAHRLQACNKPVMFLPLHKKVSRTVSNSASSKGATKSSLNNSRPLHAASPDTMKQSVLKSENTVSAMTTLKTETAVPKPKAQLERKKKSKNKKKEKLSKKIVTKPQQEIIKKPELQSQSPCQVIEKKEVKKQEHPKELQPALAVSPPAQAEPLATNSEQPSAPEVVEHALDANQSEIEYIGQLERDALEVQSEIQQEIHRHWKPPAGLGPTLTCHIKALIGWDGIVQTVSIEKKSGVLAYDMSVRNAVRAMQLPKAVWGKELILQFKEQG